MIRHLHKDYNTSFCGRDAAHILMTHNEGEADCPGCEQGLRAHLAEQARLRDEEARRTEEDLVRQAEERAERKRRDAEIDRQRRAEAAALEERLQRLERAVGLASPDAAQG